MPYDVQEARAEITKKIGDKKTHLEMYCAISDYLGGGKPSILPTLIKLESELAEKIGNEIEEAKTYFAGYVQRAASTEPRPPSPFSRLMTGHMATLESQHGFNTKIYTTYLGFLPAKIFENEAAKARHFKDLVSPQHGEYAHRIQWYLLMSSNVITDNQGKTLFQAVLGIPGLWDILFDRLPADDPFQCGPDDYRRPENVTTYLTSPGFIEVCPLIGNFILARKNKRTNTVAQNMQGWRKDYVARKLYRQTYAACLGPEKIAVDKIIERRILDPEVDEIIHS